MDFRMIEEKLDNSVPGKEVPKLDQPRYLSTDQFITDVRLIFSNCVKFSDPEHTISLMGRRLEEPFDKSIKNLLPPEEVEPAPVKKAPPPPPSSAPAKQREPRRPSMRVSGCNGYSTRSGRTSHNPTPADGWRGYGRQGWWRQGPQSMINVHCFFLFLHFCHLPMLAVS